MLERKFIPTREEDTFELGRIDNHPFSGVYLSPAYMDRLREVLYAATLRLDTIPDSVADAVKNVLGIVNRLTQTHSEQLKTEGYPWTDADRAARARGEKELDDALNALRRFRPLTDDPEGS